MMLFYVCVYVCFYFSVCVDVHSFCLIRLSCSSLYVFWFLLFHLLLACTLAFVLILLFFSPLIPITLHTQHTTHAAHYTPSTLHTQHTSPLCDFLGGGSRGGRCFSVCWGCSSCSVCSATASSSSGRMVMFFSVCVSLSVNSICLLMR